MKFRLNLLPLIAVLSLIPTSFASIEDPSKDYSSIIRYPLCRASYRIRYPRTSKEVKLIVEEAIWQGVTVKAFGERYSMSDIICTDGIPIDMRHMKSFNLHYDKTATFGAGSTLYEAFEFLRKKRRALIGIPDYGNITLGGALGSGAHGSSIKYPSSLSSQVVELKIVNGRGKIVTISDRKDLQSFKVHLGLLGIVLTITFRTVPLRKVRAHNYAVSDKVLTNGKAMHWARTSDHIMLVWFPTFKNVAVFNQTFVSAKTRGNAVTRLAPSSTYAGNLFSVLYGETTLNLTSSDCTEASTLGVKMSHELELQITKLYVSQMYTRNSTSNDFVNPAVGYPHKIMATTCSKDLKSERICDWLHQQPFTGSAIAYEMGCALADLRSIVAVIKDIMYKTPTAFLVSGIEIRFCAKTNIFMSTSYKRDSVYFKFVLVRRGDEYNDASGNLAGFQTIIQALAKKFHCRSGWASSGLVYHSQPMLDLKLDPHARQQFIDAMKKFDPNGVFMNNFGRRLMYNDTIMDGDPLSTRCALLDNCFCSKDSDCADSQTCITITGYDYNVCETKNIVRMKRFNRNKFSTNFDIVNWFYNTVPSLILSLKC